MSNALEQLKKFNLYVENALSYFEEPERYPPQPKKHTRELDPKKWKKRQLQKQARKKQRIKK